MEKFLKKAKAVNRRRDARYTLPNLAAYTDEGECCREKLVNVSLSGCCLETSVNVREGDHMLIHFIASPTFYSVDDSFCLDGCVVWKSSEKIGRHNYGFSFVPPKSPFFLNETLAFKEQVARLACEQHIKK